MQRVDECRCGYVGAWVWECVGVGGCRVWVNGHGGEYVPVVLHALSRACAQNEMTDTRTYFD